QIGQVIDFGIARGNLNCRNVATISVVKHLLPRRPPRQVQNMRAMPWDDVPALYKALRSDALPSSEALAFVLLTLTRSTEVRVMRWPEVDIAKAVWTLPAGRTKMFKVHRVALSTPALAILQRMQDLQGQLGGSEYVFPGRDLDGPYSHNMLRQTMKRVG